jgi:hypothetical protein
MVLRYLIDGEIGRESRVCQSRVEGPLRTRARSIEYIARCSYAIRDGAKMIIHLAAFS